MSTFTLKVELSPHPVSEKDAFISQESCFSFRENTKFIIRTTCWHLDHSLYILSWENSVAFLGKRYQSLLMFDDFIEAYSTANDAGSELGCHLWVIPVFPAGLQFIEDLEYAGCFLVGDDPSYDEMLIKEFNEDSDREKPFTLTPSNSQAIPGKAKPSAKFQGFARKK